MGNDATKVSVGKPAIIGAVFNAPIETTLPTDATTALAEGFTGLGYLSDAGWTVSPNATEGTNITAFGGDSVLKTDPTINPIFKFVLIQTDVPALKVYFGDENVTVDSETGRIAVDVSNKPRENKAWVFNLVGSGGRPERVVVPSGKVTALEDITYADGTVIGYGVTLSTTPDAGGSYYRKLIDPVEAG
jgi:hypothetical protein